MPEDNGQPPTSTLTTASDAVATQIENGPVDPAMLREPAADQPSPSQRADILHMKTFMGGRKSVTQVHREVVFRNKKCVCGSRKVILRIKMFQPLTEIVDMGKRGVMFLQILANQNGGSIPVVDMMNGPTRQKMVRISDTFVCSSCRVEAEVLAAKHPSSWLCEIDRGPKDITPQVSVPVGPRT
jgi:hypothetical protein